MVQILVKVILTVNGIEKNKISGLCYYYYYIYSFIYFIIIFYYYIFKKQFIFHFSAFLCLPWNSIGLMYIYLHFGLANLKEYMSLRLVIPTDLIMI